MGLYKNMLIDADNETKFREMTKRDDTIINAQTCGLVYAGDYKNGEPQFLGTNAEWNKFNDGEF